MSWPDCKKQIKNLVNLKILEAFCVKIVQYELIEPQGGYSSGIQV